MSCSKQRKGSREKSPGTFLRYLIVIRAECIGAEAAKRFASAPTVVKHVVKKFSEFRVVRKWWKSTRFSPENAKNKAENEPFSALFGLSDWT